MAAPGGWRGGGGELSGGCGRRSKSSQLATLGGILLLVDSRGEETVAGIHLLENRRSIRWLMVGFRQEVNPPGESLLRLRLSRLAGGIFPRLDSIGLWWNPPAGNHRSVRWPMVGFYQDGIAPHLRLRGNPSCRDSLTTNQWSPGRWNPAGRESSTRRITDPSAGHGWKDGEGPGHLVAGILHLHLRGNPSGETPLPPSATSHAGIHLRESFTAALVAGPGIPEIHPCLGMA